MGLLTLHRVLIVAAILMGAFMFVLGVAAYLRHGGLEALAGGVAGGAAGVGLGLYLRWFLRKRATRS